ncbi:hypothetical protein L2E82_29010 [Cichorium intybus]|uniref:Uncharacterized protein n=1 Tax=Cichorium intybus TaxID=13427 RepID=A0ACB9CX08_CICIN|nr:hypothetical protein L2E82_29010 [Cichorium intybus]
MGGLGITSPSPSDEGIDGDLPVLLAASQVYSRGALFSGPPHGRGFARRQGLRSPGSGISKKGLLWFPGVGAVHFLCALFRLQLQQALLHLQ